jgi:hypothetical protein
MMKKTAGISGSLALAVGIISCGSLKMRPLDKSADSYECYGEPDGSKTVYSPIEERLFHQGAMKSKKINMASGIGMIEKTARLFVLDKSEIKIVLHLMHPIDIEIRNYGFAIRGDSGILAAGDMRVDYRVTIGEMTEEHMYLDFPAEKMAHLLDDGQVSIRIEDISFELPFECRETFREIRGKNRER